MKKILVLTPRFPYPVIGGDRLRIYEICRALSGEYRLGLISLCESRKELEAPIPDDGVFESVERVLLPRWRSWISCLLAFPTATPLQVAYYRSTALQERLGRLVSQHDAVVVHLIRGAEWVKGLKIPKFLEMTDAISLNYSRVRDMRARGRLDFRALIFSIEARRLRHYEASIVEHFDKSFLVSNVDRQFLFGESSSALERVIVCSNGVDTSMYPYQFAATGKDILFIGNMRSLQNLDAATFLAREIFPLVRLRVPEARLRLVGRISRGARARLASYAGVFVSGEVTNVAEAAAGSAVGVCPVRLGAGVQNKVLEYMSLGVPVVTTDLGLEGFAAEPGKDLLVANDRHGIADAIVRVISDRALAEVLSRNGRRYVEENHVWNRTLSPMLTAVNQAIGRSSGETAVKST